VHLPPEGGEDTVNNRERMRASPKAGRSGKQETVEKTFLVCQGRAAAREEKFLWPKGQKIRVRPSRVSGVGAGERIGERRVGGGVYFARIRV